jgi:hypothetical protein
MHTSTNQGLRHTGTRIHRPYKWGQTTISSLGSYTSGEGIATITTAAALQTYAGCTIWLGTTQSDGQVIWKVRTRARATANSTTVKVAAFGQYDYHNLDAIKSTNEFLPHIKRPRYKQADSTWYMDWEEAYTDEGDTPSPQAQIGTAIVHFGSSSGIGYFTSFDGSRSMAWANGASISSYAWRIGETGSTNTGATPSWSYTWGYVDASDPSYSEQHIKLTVTDSNGKTHTTRRLFFGANGTSSIDEPESLITCTEITEEFGSGARAKFTARTTEALADVQDGNAIVVYGYPYHTGWHILPPMNFALDTAVYYNGSLGTGDLPVLFEGYIIAESFKQNDATGEVTFEAVTADALLEAQYQSPLSFLESATPADWWQLDDLTPNRTAWHIIRYFSTLADVRDVDIGQFVNVPMNSTTAAKYFDANGGGFMSQLRAIFDSTLSTISFDACGTCYIEQDLQLQDDAENIAQDLPLHVEFMHGYFTTDRTYLQPTAQIYLGGADGATATEERIPQGVEGYGAALGEIKAGINATQAQITALAKRKYQRDAKRNAAGLTRIGIEVGNMPFNVVPQSVIAVKTNFGNGRTFNPYGLTRSRTPQTYSTVTSGASANGLYYFLSGTGSAQDNEARGIIGDEGIDVFGQGGTIIPHLNSYANNSAYVAIGKVFRSNAQVLAGGNNCSSDAFHSVNPPVYALGSNVWTAMLYTGAAGGFAGTLDSSAAILSYLNTLYAAWLDIGADVGALTYKYLTGDDILLTHYWHSTTGHYVHDYIVWATTANPFPMLPPRAASDTYIYTVPRALTWSFDAERGDMRCRYELEPISYEGNDGTGFPA